VHYGQYYQEKQLTSIIQLVLSVLDISLLIMIPR